MTMKAARAGSVMTNQGKALTKAKWQERMRDSYLLTTEGSLVTFSDPLGRWPAATLCISDSIDLTMGPIVLFATVEVARTNTEMRRRPSGAIHVIKRHRQGQDGKQYVRTYCDDVPHGVDDPLSSFTDRFPSGGKRCLWCARASQNP